MVALGETPSANALSQPDRFATGASRYRAPLLRVFNHALAVARRGGNRMARQPRIARVGKSLAPAVNGQLLNNGWVAVKLRALLNGSNRWPGS